MRISLLLLTCGVLASACSWKDIKRVGPLDKRPEWQKTSPYTGESQSRRQGTFEDALKSKRKWKLPAHW